MVELRPLLVSRFANLVPGALVLVLGLWGGFAGDLPWLVAAVPAVVGAVLAVRGYRLGVTITDRDLVIHGLVLTRTIPRGLIAGVTDWPEVVWRSPLPGPQHSRIVAFRNSASALRAIRRHNAECVATLRSTVSPRPAS